MVSKSPFGLLTVCNELFKQGIKTTKKSLKRFLKKLGYSYKRARAKIKKCDREAFEIAKKEIEELKDRVKNDNSSQLYFFDESSFSLTPNIPYGWSLKNETITLDSKRSNSLKVLGFLGLDNKLKSYTTKGIVNSDVVIKVFDDFIENLPKNSNTTIILDNASTHTSKLFKAKLKDWIKKGVTIYFLPPYSPELNRIEILWRFMKYHWINITDYASTQTLEDYIHRVLASYGKGKEFEINFG